MAVAPNTAARIIVSSLNFFSSSAVPVTTALLFSNFPVIVLFFQSRSGHRKGVALPVATPSFAKELTPSWFIEQSLNDTNLLGKSTIFSELPSENYYKFFHKDGEITNEEAVNQIIAGTYEEVETNEESLKPNNEQPELVGVGIYQDGNTIYADFLYFNEKENMEELRSTALTTAIERHDNPAEQSFSKRFC